LFEQIRPAGFGVFSTQPGEDIFQQSQRPSPLKKFVRAEAVNGFSRIMVLGHSRVQRQDNGAAAALLCPRLVILVREEMLQRSQQEGAEPAFGLVCLMKIVLLD
jgi:hypothetical protein